MDWLRIYPLVRFLTANPLPNATDEEVVSEVNGAISEIGEKVPVRALWRIKLARFRPPTSLCDISIISTSRDLRANKLTCRISEVQIEVDPEHAKDKFQVRVCTRLARNYIELLVIDRRKIKYFPRPSFQVGWLIH